jgi:hypothetical protein
MVQEHDRFALPVDFVIPIEPIYRHMRHGLLLRSSVARYFMGIFWRPNSTRIP